MGATSTKRYAILQIGLLVILHGFVNARFDSIVNVTVGDVISLLCTTTSTQSTNIVWRYTNQNDAAIRYVFIRESVVDSYKGRFTVSSGDYKLTIYGVLKNDSGHYTCADNGGVDILSTTTLNVRTAVSVDGERYSTPTTSTTSHAIPFEDERYSTPATSKDTRIDAVVMDQSATKSLPAMSILQIVAALIIVGVVVALIFIFSQHKIRRLFCTMCRIFEQNDNVSVVNQADGNVDITGQITDSQALNVIDRRPSACIPKSSGDVSADTTAQITESQPLNVIGSRRSSSVTESSSVHSVNDGESIQTSLL